MASRPLSSLDPPEALFLDLDDTLLDNSLHPKALARTCREIVASQPGLDAARLLEANGEVWKVYWTGVEGQWNLGDLDGAAVRLEAWRRTLRACGCGDDSVAQRASETHQRLTRAAYRPFDDVRDLVASVKATGTPLALITNGAPDTQRDKLDALEIAHWFDAVVVSGEVGVAKPNPAIFELVLDRLAVGREAAWHVGDSLASDVAGANAAGLTSVWLNRSGARRGEGDPAPDLEVRSLAELVPLLIR